MVVPSLKLSDLKGLSAEEISERMAPISKPHPANGELATLQDRILEFEGRYELSSESMRTRYRSGELHETAEICQWLILLSVRDELIAAHE